MFAVDLAYPRINVVAQKLVESRMLLEGAEKSLHHPRPPNVWPFEAAFLKIVEMVSP